MKLFLIATRDIKTDSYGVPITTQHLGSAIRAFEDQIQGKTPNGDQTLINHPEDFELYQLGYYDDNTGEFENAKMQLAVGANYARKQQAMTRYDAVAERTAQEYMNGRP